MVSKVAVTVRAARFAREPRERTPGTSDVRSPTTRHLTSERHHPLLSVAGCAGDGAAPRGVLVLRGALRGHWGVLRGRADERPRERRQDRGRHGADRASEIQHELDRSRAERRRRRSRGVHRAAFAPECPRALHPAGTPGRRRAPAGPTAGASGGVRRRRKAVSSSSGGASAIYFAIGPIVRRRIRRVFGETSARRRRARGPDARPALPPVPQAVR